MFWDKESLPEADSVSGCDLHAPTQPAALADVLQAAPRLLQMLFPDTKARLAATSRQLQCLVHDHVTSITITQLRHNDTQSQVEELQLLVSGRWPCLQRLKIEHRKKLDTEVIRQRSQALPNKTASLDLSMNFLAVDAMSQLVLGKWPALKHLDLSHNNLDTDAIALLTQADWQLEVLQLCDNRIDVEAVKLLTTAQWPLRQLDLGHNKLDDSALSHLCSGRWPELQTLVLTRNYLHANAQFCQTDWPNLVSVNLSNCLLFKADIAGLREAHWPNLLTLNLSYNVLDEVSMTHMVKGIWPELKCVYLVNSFLNDAAIKVLSRNCWHKLEYLGLHLNPFLMRSAASLLSSEQRRIAVF